MNKKELIALAEELLQAESLEDRESDLQLLKREYKFLLGRDEDTLYAQEETDKFLALFLELAKKEPKLLASPYEEKKKIIEEMKKLLNKEEILVANRQMNQYSEDFKKAGRSGNKEQDDALWEEFRQVKDQFYEKKRAYFDELEKSNEEKRMKKEDIIERAKKVLDVESIKDANNQMDALKKEWKEVGYSGKGDEHLWKDFTKVMDDFREKKKERHHEMIKLFEEREQKKEELIKTMKRLVNDAEYTDEEVEKVKGLRNEWKAIGFAGKEKDDELYKRFNEAIQEYFNDLKLYKN